MPTDPSGLYSLPAGYKAIPNTTILTTQHNPPLEDIAAALTGRVTRDGSGSMTGPLKLQAGAPTLPNEATRKDYVDTQVGKANALNLKNPIGVDLVLTVDDAEAIVWLTDATAQTVTLPANQTALKPLRFRIYNTSDVPKTIALPADNYLYHKRGIANTATPYLLAPRSGLVITGSNWNFFAIEDRPIARPIVITANTTFTAAHLDSLIEITATGTIAATIPTAPPFGSFRIWNHSPVVQNVAPASGTIYEPTGAAVSPLVLQPGEVVTLLSDAFLWFVADRYPAKVRVTVPKRQTVLSGPADANGLPTFFPATSANLTLTLQNVAGGTALVATIANGFDSSGQYDLGLRITTNLAVNVSASATNYIWLDDTGALGASTLAPIYQYGGTASITNGQHTYIIGQGQMYVGNGSAATPTNRVFIGEAVASGSAITSTIAYAYQRFFQYLDTGSLPTTGTKTVKNHNIGTSLGIIGTFALQCAIAEDNYAVGDIVYGVTTESGAGPWWMMLEPVMLRNTMYFSTGNLNAYVLPNATNGAGQTLTLANWRYILIATSVW